MGIMKFVVLSFILVSTCFAVENRNFSELMELEKQLNIQKREKCPIEDDFLEGLDQRRSERQSNLAKKPMMNIRLQPKTLTSPIIPVLKPALLQKPLNFRIDTTPQTIPTKIPVILKTVKVVPNAAHAIRLKMLENQPNDTTIRMETNSNKENAPLPKDPLPPCKDDIPFIIDDRSDNRRKESEVTPEKDKVNLDKDGKLTANDNKQNLLNNHEVPIDKPVVSENIPIVHHPLCFFVDDDDPPTNKPKCDTARSNEVMSNKVREIPLTKQIKANNEDNDEQVENDAEIMRISNGTHVISIKKINNNVNRRKNEPSTQEGNEEHREPIEERIIKPKPPKPSAEEPAKIPLGGSNKAENVVPSNTAPKDKVFNKGEKEQHTCICCITNHKYEEVEERAPVSPQIAVQPITTYNDGTQASWSYLQNLPNPYFNPYQILLDQYKRNYGMQTNPIIYTQETNDAYAEKHEFVPYYPIEIQPNYDYLKAYYPEFNMLSNDQPKLDTNYPEVPIENPLDRIWRTWKDVEIKIRKAKEDDDIDIRRNNFDGAVNNSDVCKVVSHVQAINPNAYLTNQNGALIYPYPTYRYMR